MQIVRCSKQACYKALGHVGTGSSVCFRRPFNGEAEGEVFIVTKVCSSYWPERVDACDKTPVTNLRTGKLSYVDSQRDVMMMHAQVTLE